MRPALFSTMAAIVLTLSSSIQAGGLIERLPKDGSWTKFNLEFLVEIPQNMNQTGTLTVRSVGRVTEKGKKYRWVEIEFQLERNGKKEKKVIKLLVAEKDIMPGAKKSPEILRGWKKNADRDPVELTDAEKQSSGEAAFFLSGPLKNQKTLKKKQVIDFQKGRLKIPSGITGKADFKIGSNGPAGVKSDITQSIWTHKSVPFGTAMLIMKMEVTLKDQLAIKAIMTFTVQDYGTGAKSVLPDKK